jgi:single-strand DNA-binding protein
MASLNKVFLMGNITRDIDVRYTPSGVAVCDMSLAINRFFGGEGQQREETTFVDIVVWNKQAESCGRFLRKGSPCFVEGRLQLDTWEDKETGQKRSRLRVVAERVQFLSSRQDATQQPVQGNQRFQGQQAYQANNVPPAPQVQQAPNPSFQNVQPVQQVPPMPDDAFNPGISVEDDIPF